MSQLVLLDAGPLVAFVKSTDNFHKWAKTTLPTVGYPYITCEPVITETLFLLSKTHGGREVVMSMLSDGVIQIGFQLGSNIDTLRDLMACYSDIPMSLADACLVKMAELNPNSTVMTIDSDFKIYRMLRNQPISVIMPEGR